MGSFNLGPLSSDGTPKSEFHSVSSQKPTDVFSFSLDNSGNINLALTGMTADADVKLYRLQDLNGDGVYDQNEQELIGNSSLPGSRDEAINIADQPAGYYLAEVSSYQSANNTAYDLRLSTTPFREPSNVLPVEKEVGALTGTQSFTDAENSSAEFGLSNDDTSDIYHFVVNTAGNFSFNLTGLTADADIRLIQDSNGNRVVEPNSTSPSGEVLGVSRQGGTADESITQFLNPGDYYVQVYQYADVPTGSQGIGYTLTMAPVA